MAQKQTWTTTNTLNTTPRVERQYVQEPNRAHLSTPTGNTTTTIANQEEKNNNTNKNIEKHSASNPAPHKSNTQ